MVFRVQIRMHTPSFTVRPPRRRTTRSAAAALAGLNDSDTQNGPRSVCSDWFGAYLVYPSAWNTPATERSGAAAGWARFLLGRLVELDQEDRLPRNVVFRVVRLDDDPTAFHRLQLAAHADFGPVLGIGGRGDGHAAACAQPIPAAELDGAVLAEFPSEGRLLHRRLGVATATQGENHPEKEDGNCSHSHLSLMPGSCRRTWLNSLTGAAFIGTLPFDLIGVPAGILPASIYISRVPIDVALRSAKHLPY